MTPAVPAKPSVREFTADHFLPHQGSVFRFEPAAGEPVELELIEVARYRRPNSNGIGREPFSLLFRGVQPRAMAPVLHTLIHEAFAPCLIYVSRIIPPAGLDPREAYYEAVFN